VALIQALNILRRYPLAAAGHSSSTHLHWLAEAFKHAFADRARHLGDPDFVSVPVARLTSRAYADTLARRIGRRVQPRDSYGSPAAPRAPSGDSPGTSHLSVVDSAGNAVALTTTINTGFGSLVVAGQSGIILNNQMDDFAARPGEPNAFGLVQGEGNTVAAGKRPLSSMSPTIVTRQGRPVLVVGASGGPSIITGTLQAISNVIDFGHGAAEAVSRSRIHHQWIPEVLLVERDLPEDVSRALVRRGHRIRIIRHPFTAVQLVLVRGGRLYGASDPRKLGAPAGY
jgi:gamma-glutamyltranspeptidase/glutathione hydrolase